jgi:hypothetical protein
MDGASRHTWTLHEPSHSLPATLLTSKIADSRRRDVSFIMMQLCCGTKSGSKGHEMNDLSQSWIHVEDPPDVASRDSTVCSLTLFPHRVDEALFTLQNDLILQ